MRNGAPARETPPANLVAVIVPPQRDIATLLELAHVNVVGALEAIEAGDIDYAIAQLWNADDQLLEVRSLAEAA